MESPRTRSPYPGTSSALSTIAGLGRCKLETIRLDQARALFERAIEIQEDALGPDHPNLIFPLTQLAEIDRRQRNLDQAAERYERALVIGERTLGPEHPDLLWALGSYALLLANRGDVEGARENLDRALQIAKEAHGSKHLGVARTLELFGFHHYQKGEYDEALQWYRRGLEIRQEIFGSNHSSSAWNLYDQACLLALSGDGDGAIATLHRALDVGWANHRIFEDDDFDSLKGTPKFEAILAEVRSRL